MILNVASIFIIRLLCLNQESLYAREVDQFRFRLDQVRSLPSSHELLNYEVNRVIAQIIREANVRRQWPSLSTVRSAFSSDFLATLRVPLEEWAFGFNWSRDPSQPIGFYRSSSGVALAHANSRGIFDLWTTDHAGFASYIILAPVLRVGRVLIGGDKLGHFIAQGLQYYERRVVSSQQFLGPLETTPEAELGWELELGDFGLEGAGVISNGDLAANAAGAEFFAHLLSRPEHDHSAYIKETRSGTFEQNRNFQILDYITDDWDEVINPSYVLSGQPLQLVRDAFVAGGPQSICAQYRSAPVEFMNEGGRQTDPLVLLNQRILDRRLGRGQVSPVSVREFCR